jgi:hypothetical protein
MTFVCLGISVVLHCAATTAYIMTNPVPTTEHAHHARADRKHAFSVGLPPSEAFLLFEPVGEKNWADGWRPVFASPEDARLHDGSVFTVNRPHPIHGSIESVWMVSRYEPPHRIEYRNVEAGRRVSWISVHCEAAGERTTRVSVRYVFTGLSKEGDDHITKMTEPAFREMIEGWSKMIANYLERGTPATP